MNVGQMKDYRFLHSFSRWTSRNIAGVRVVGLGWSRDEQGAGHSDDDVDEIVVTESRYLKMCVSMRRSPLAPDITLHGAKTSQGVLILMDAQPGGRNTTFSAQPVSILSGFSDLQSSRDTTRIPSLSELSIRDSRESFTIIQQTDR